MPTLHLCPRHGHHTGTCQPCNHERGTTTQRGYGTRHRQTRNTIAQAITAGTRPPCTRCGQPIEPEHAWHLDHTDDRTNYLGPSHATCNTQAAGRRGTPHRENTHVPRPLPNFSRNTSDDEVLLA